VKYLKVISIRILVFIILIILIPTLSNKSQHTSLEDHQHLAQELHCMQVLIKHEAYNQSKEGMQAVAQVVINRKNHKNYPSTVCDVAKQPKQFSDILSTFRKEAKGLKTAYSKLEQHQSMLVSTVAYKAVVGDSDVFQTYPDDLLWYHTKEINPSWSKKVKYMKKYGTIGSHVFYVKV